MSAALRLTRAAPAGSGGAWLLALPVAAFIVVFLAWPVATVLHTAFAWHTVEDRRQTKVGCWRWQS